MKEPIPHIELTDEDVGLVHGQDIKKLPRSILDELPYKTLYWMCGIGECKSISTVRDYGVHPWYYWHRKWINVMECYRICGRHWKQYGHHWKEKRAIPEHIHLCMPVEKDAVKNY